MLNRMLTRHWPAVLQQINESLQSLQVSPPAEPLKMAGEPGCLPRFGFDEARVMDDCQALYKITKVLPHSPAQKSGLRVGDIIEAIDSVPVETWNNEDLVEIYEKPTSVPIKVSRNGETLRRSIRAEVMCTQ